PGDRVLPGHPAAAALGHRHRRADHRPAHPGRVRRGGDAQLLHPDHRDRPARDRAGHARIRARPRGGARPAREHPAAARPGAVRPPIRWRLGWTAPLFVLVVLAVVLAALAVPLWVTVTGLARRLGGAGDPIDWSALATATVNTAQWGGAAALVATLCALPVTVLAVRYPGRLSALIERSTWIAHALPGVIMALALAYLAVRWAYPLYQTSTLLVVGYVVMFLPLAVGSQQVGIAQASPRFDEMSRSLGSGPVRTFARVTAPLALPAIGVG